MYPSIVSWHRADCGADFLPHSGIYSELRKQATVEDVIERYSVWKKANIGIISEEAIKITNQALIIGIEKIEKLLTGDWEQFIINAEQQLHDFYTDMQNELNKYGLTKLLKFYEMMMRYYLERSKLDNFLDYVEKIIALDQLMSQSITHQVLHTSLSVSTDTDKTIFLYGKILEYLTCAYLKTIQEKEKLEQLDKLKKATHIVRDWMEKINSRMHEKVKKYHCCMRELIKEAINYLQAGDHKSVNDLDCEIDKYLELIGENADQDIYSSLVEWSIAQAEYAIKQSDTQALAHHQEKVIDLWEQGSDKPRGEREVSYVDRQVASFCISTMEYSAKQSRSKDIDLSAEGKGGVLTFQKKASEILEQVKAKLLNPEIWASRVKIEKNLGDIYAIEQKMFIARAKELAEEMWESSTIQKSFKRNKQQLQLSLEKLESLYWKAVNLDPIDTSIIEQTLDFYIEMAERALNKEDLAHLEKFYTLFETFAYITERLTTSSNKVGNIIVESKRLKFEEFLQQHYISTNNEAGLKDLTLQIE